MRDNVLLGCVKSSQDRVCTQVNLITVNVPVDAKKKLFSALQKRG